MLIIFLFVLAIIPAKIASNKGRKFWVWYVYGVLLLLPAIIHATMFLKPTPEAEQEALEKEGYMLCPYCKERVKQDALICPHCRKEIATGKAISAYVPDENERQEEEQ